MINRIAAGEVVERPASVVKELIENGVDAGARRIEIATAAGGMALIRVTDDGRGMSRPDLVLAVERHCTSKLEDDLNRIDSMGFRGEALASIGAVARLAITSRLQGSDDGWRMTVDGGRTSDPGPSPIAVGTRIEVTDLFFATPARLKFMKSERAEAAAITDIVRQTAMAHPEIRFALSGSDRSLLELAATGPNGLLHRLEQVNGKEFQQNAIAVDAERNGVHLRGYIGLPTFNRGNAGRQYFFVNNRPVRDKQLFGALRAAYVDFLARDRHAIAVLFVELASSEVDVNVHPAKAEVRFRDPGLIRGLIVGAIRQALGAAGHRSTSTGASAIRESFTPGATTAYRPKVAVPVSQPQGFGESEQVVLAEIGSSADIRPEIVDRLGAEAVDRPLGAARAQLHENYIIAQTRDGLVVVDQHAAHERLVYERLKKAMRSGGVATQMLLVPEIVELAEDDVGRLLSRADDLAGFGLIIEAFGPGAIAVREVPAMLDGVDVKGLINDLVDEIGEFGSASLLTERIDQVAGTIACHGSVRSGRRLRPEEMDALLRQMEATPHSGQCIHGRPTYIELKLSDLERLFGRR